ncbi:MAG: hypothetical protein M3024_06405 [Candidatus Dormibacteraeota bacterium]|nr:hypothetical protein [Candidatus Dormibacteraeota bacterium]
MDLLTLGLRVLAFAAGATVVGIAVNSSVRTVILPRAVPSVITRRVFDATRRLFELRIGRGATYERRDAVMAGFAPTALLLLLVTWLVLILAGFTFIFWALGDPLDVAFRLSGSSIVTLGFQAPSGIANTIGVVSEGLLGLIELALLIAYLPAIYGAFQRRESLVTKLEVRAGSPPSGIELLERFHRLHSEASLGDVWGQFEDWFVDIEESHTSLPSLNFFRSPQPRRSWITAAGAVLDGAALYSSVLEHPQGRDTRADLCIRAGYVALRYVCDFFKLPYNATPQRGDPISIAREEFDEAVNRLQASGLDVRADREAAWADFAGWRVNYDDALLAVAQLVSAPYAPWSSDRGAARRPRRLRALIGF